MSMSLRTWLHKVTAPVDETEEEAHPVAIELWDCINTILDKAGTPQETIARIGLREIRRNHMPSWVNYKGDRL